MKKVWVVTDYKGKTDTGTAFDIKGVFSSEEKAKSACRKATEGYGALNIDEEFSEKTIEWPGFVYPFRSNDNA